MREKSDVSQDIAFLHSPTEDGQGARILRLRKGKVEAAEVRPARDGQPLNSQELVRLHPRENTPRVCDVEVLHDSREDADASPEPNGPARVSSKNYRDNWDRIFAGEGSEADGAPGDAWNLN
jgi:hypothetical protein